MIFHRVLIILFFISCYYSCREEIVLLPKKEQLTGISIQSQLVKGNPSVVTADIQRLFTFSAESRKSLPISSVTLEDDRGNEFILANKRVGTYVGVISADDPNFKVEYDRAYRLKAIIENQEYESSFELLLPVPKMESLEFELFEKKVVNAIGDYAPRQFARFQVNTPLKAEGNVEKSYLKWSLLEAYERTNCLSFASPDFSHLEIIDGNKVQGDNLNQQTIFEILIQAYFRDPYFLIIYQESLSESAYNYWQELATLSNDDGNRFQATPGIIRSNFKNTINPNEDVFGYFYVSAQDTMIIKACLEEGSYEISRSPISYCDYKNGVPAEFWNACK